VKSAFFALFAGENLLLGFFQQLLYWTPTGFSFSQWPHGLSFSYASLALLDIQERQQKLASALPNSWVRQRAETYRFRVGGLCVSQKETRTLATTGVCFRRVASYADSVATNTVAVVRLIVPLFDGINSCACFKHAFEKSCSHLLLRSSDESFPALLITGLRCSAKCLLFDCLWVKAAIVVCLASWPASNCRWWR